jgi:hypothetical protein
MMYWILGGVLFAAIWVGWLWYEVKRAPVREDYDDQ